MLTKIESTKLLPPDRWGEFFDSGLREPQQHFFRVGMGDGRPRRGLGRDKRVTDHRQRLGQILDLNLDVAASDAKLRLHLKRRPTADAFAKLAASLERMSSGSS